MKTSKTAIIFALELTALWFISEWVAEKWTLPEIQYRGEEEFWAQTLLITIFIFNATFYLILHLLKALEQKGFSTIYKEKKYFLSSAVGIILLVLSGYAIGGTLLYRPSLWVLLLPPIPLFLLHLGSAKIITRER